MALITGRDKMIPCTATQHSAMAWAVINKGKHDTLKQAWPQRPDAALALGARAPLAQTHRRHCAEARTHSSPLVLQADEGLQ